MGNKNKRHMLPPPEVGEYGIQRVELMVWSPDDYDDENNDYPYEWVVGGWFVNNNKAIVSQSANKQTNSTYAKCIYLETYIYIHFK